MFTKKFFSLKVILVFLISSLIVFCVYAVTTKKNITNKAVVTNEQKNDVVQKVNKTVSEQDKPQADTDTVTQSQENKSVDTDIVDTINTTSEENSDTSESKEDDVNDLLTADVLSGVIPRASLRYRSELIRTSRFYLGLEAPVALFAGQLHQESTWKNEARSKYASGLAQFTPATAKWIVKLFPELKKNDPINPKWAMRAMVLYNMWLMDQVNALDVCNDYAFALSGYNGGLGWVQKDKNLTKKKGGNPNVWWNSVEKYTSRGKRANKENRDYVRKILLKHQILYNQNNWPGTIICAPKKEK